MKQILLSLYNFFVQILSEFCRLLKFCRLFFTKSSISSLTSNIKKEIKDTTEKAKDLYTTNLQLGLYHFYRGNLVDAKMRFGMLKAVYKERPIPYYNLARCYLIDGDNLKAKKVFEDANKAGKREYKEVKFFLDILDNKHLDRIPKFLPKELFEYLAHDYVESVLIGKCYIGHKLIFDEVIRHFGQKITGLKVLDLGCGTGVCTHFLKLHDICDFTCGVDLSQNMLAIAKKCLVDNKPIFTTIYQQDIVSFLQEHEEKYDLIIASDSLGYVTSNLEEITYRCISILNNSGVLVFLVRSCTSQKEHEFDVKKTRFSYSFEYLQKIGERINLKTTIKKCKFENSGDGFIVCYSVI